MDKSEFIGRDANHQARISERVDNLCEAIAGRLVGIGRMSVNTYNMAEAKVLLKDCVCSDMLIEILCAREAVVFDKIKMLQPPSLERGNQLSLF